MNIRALCSNDVYLSPETYIIAAGNRTEDKSGAQRLWAPRKAMSNERSLVWEGHDIRRRWYLEDPRTGKSSGWRSTDVLSGPADHMLVGYGYRDGRWWVNESGKAQIYWVDAEGEARAVCVVLARMER